MNKFLTRRQFSTALRARAPTPNQHNARVEKAAGAAAQARNEGDSASQAMKKGAGAAAEGHANEPPILNKDGAVGKEFKADGAIGSIGEKVGGPFASDGAIGKNFNPDGKVGGTVNETLGKKE